jgi:hypothetical protein
LLGLCDTLSLLHLLLFLYGKDKDIILKKKKVKIRIYIVILQSSKSSKLPGWGASVGVRPVAVIWPNCREGSVWLLIDKTDHSVRRFAGTASAPPTHRIFLWKKKLLRACPVLSSPLCTAFFGPPRLITGRRPLPIQGSCLIRSPRRVCCSAAF